MTPRFSGRVGRVSFGLVMVLRSAGLAFGRSTLRSPGRVAFGVVALRSPGRMAFGVVALRSPGRVTFGVVALRSPRRSSTAFRLPIFGSAALVAATGLALKSPGRAVAAIAGRP